jgi:multicomponent Na+:H+ antiporter subunit E
MFVKIATFFALILVWLGLLGFSGQFLNILLVPSLLIVALWQLDLMPKNNHFKIESIFYFFWLLKEIWNSARAVVRITTSSHLMIEPVMEPIKSVQKTDMGIVLYANSITLTPGTVTLSVEDNALLVHALDVSFMDDLKSGEMDRRISKIMK